MKKILLSTLALLGVMGLVACSNQEGTSSSQKTVQETRQSSTSSSKGKKVTSLKGSSESPFVLYTDEELENARTVGDFKALYALMMDRTVAHSEEAGASLTGSAKETYETYLKDLKEKMETSKARFNESMDTIGSEDTEVPEATRATIVEKFETARKQAEASENGTAPSSETPNPASDENLSEPDQ